MSAVPHRSNAQRLAALAEGNRIRFYRKNVKLNLKAGTRCFTELRADPDMRTAHVADFLLAIPKIGSRKAAELMRRASIPPMKTFGGLSDRQWHALVTGLRATPAGQQHEMTSTHHESEGIAA